MQGCRLLPWTCLQIRIQIAAYLMAMLHSYASSSLSPKQFDIDLDACSSACMGTILLQNASSG